jgi:hypothetical protein
LNCGTTEIGNHFYLIGCEELSDGIVIYVLYDGLWQPMVGPEAFESTINGTGFLSIFLLTVLCEPEEARGQFLT